MSFEPLSRLSVELGLLEAVDLLLQVSDETTPGVGRTLSTGIQRNILSLINENNQLKALVENEMADGDVLSCGPTLHDALSAYVERNYSGWLDEESVTQSKGNGAQYEWGADFAVVFDDESTMETYRGKMRAAGHYVPGGVLVTWWEDDGVGSLVKTSEESPQGVEVPL